MLPNVTVSKPSPYSRGPDLNLGSERGYHNFNFSQFPSVRRTSYSIYLKIGNDHFYQHISNLSFKFDPTFDAIQHGLKRAFQSIKRLDTGINNLSLMGVNFRYRLQNEQREADWILQECSWH
jgi:hypothetical protein